MNFSKKSRYGLRALIDLSVYSKESHVALAVAAAFFPVHPNSDINHGWELFDVR